MDFTIDWGFFLGVAMGGGITIFTVWITSTDWWLGNNRKGR